MCARPRELIDSAGEEKIEPTGARFADRPTQTSQAPWLST
jgi:hypothetical protein